MKRLFAIQAYGMPGRPFPKFWDGYKTLTQARAAAKQAIRDGWRHCEILRDEPRKPGYFGIERTIVEQVTA